MHKLNILKINISIFFSIIFFVANSSELSLTKFMSEDEAQKVDSYGGYRKYQLINGLRMFFLNNPDSFCSQIRASIMRDFIKKFYLEKSLIGDVADKSRVDLELEKVTRNFRLSKVMYSTVYHCSICQNDIEKELSLRKCFWSDQHAFHSECVLPWLQQSENSCPNCRRKFIPTVNDFVASVAMGQWGDVVRFIESGVDVNAKDSKRSAALIEASRAGYSGIVQLLLENGADVNIVDLHRHTPLIVASERGHADIAFELCLAGADTGAVTTYGYTALKWAKFYGYEKIIRILRSYGAK